MNIKDSIFSLKGKNKKFWEDKELFGFLNEEFDCICDTLSLLGIKKVVAFDELGNNWSDWVCRDELTLCVMPISEVINQRGQDTINKIMDMDLDIVENMYPIDINTDEICQGGDFIRYFPTRNLIIALINPFLTRDLFTLIRYNISEQHPCFLTEDEISDLILTNQYVQSFEHRRNRCKSEVSDYEERIETARNNYFEYINTYNEKKRLLEAMDLDKNKIKERLASEIEGIKSLQIVKNVDVADRIYVDFGDIYITGKVKTGEKENENGIFLPIIEEKKVYIGNIKFVIGAGSIKVENSNSYGNYQHPHAYEGKICFGQVEAEATALLANLDLVKLVKLLYSWVYSYNEDDVYTKLENFYNMDKEVEQ